MKITARDIDKVLKQRHEADIYISECKNGPTHYASHNRMDGWAMKKSWANPLSICYEIKVSRSDFIQDDKWRAYLPYCNQFYFVCPTGLIDKSEVPEESGLMWVSKTGTRVYTKKKAKYRDVEIPEELYKYILFSRSQFTNGEYVPESQVEYWKKWLAKKEESRELGYNVSRKIMQKYQNDVEKVQRDVKVASERMAEYAEVKELLKEMGYKEGKYIWKWNVEKKLKSQVSEKFKEKLGEISRLAKHLVNEAE